MFFAILYAIILILFAVGGSPKEGGSTRFPAWGNSALLCIMLAIIGWALFEAEIRS